MPTPERPWLRRLFRLLQASKAGYDTASARARDPQLRALLFAMSSNRLIMLHDLERELVHSGNADLLAERGSLRGRMHRRWMEVCAVLTTRDDRQLLRECERGEKYMLGTLERALRVPGLPATTRTLFQEVQRAIATHLEDIVLLQGGQLGWG